jgi:hypothetical protein
VGAGFGPNSREILVADLMLKDMKFFKREDVFMKRLVWLAALGWVFVSVESTQAVTDKAIMISVAGTEKLTTLSDSFAQEIAAKETLVTPKTTTVTTTTKSTSTVTTSKTSAIPAPTTLSSLLLEEERSLVAIETESRDGYEPELLISKYDPKPPAPTTTKPASPKPAGGTNVVPDQASTAGLFGLALLGTVAMKKKLVL